MENSVLVIDDSNEILMIVESILSDFYDVYTAVTGEEGLEIAYQKNPSLILLDIILPGVNGFKVCEILRQNETTKETPIIFLTSLDNPIDETYAFKIGGTDFVAKPFARSALLSRVRAHLIANKSKETLLHVVEKRTKELRESQLGLVNTLSKIYTSKSKTNDQHISFVSDYASVLAKKLGYSDDECETIRLATKLHDVGLLGLPDSLILNEEIYTDKERKEMQYHTTYGGMLLEQHEGNLLKLAKVICEQHHERANGTGYPKGLRRSEINEIARIVAVADVFEALTNNRAYRDKWSFKDAFNYIVSNSDDEFDKIVVDAFFMSKKELKSIYDLK